uniref:Profilin n=1 Tax=Globodera rostochiensis TaxID=31243 RepID=A0A914HZK0_GLORO
MDANKWHTFVNQLAASGPISKAAICGQDGSIWAKSDNFNLDPMEANVVVNAFKNPNSTPNRSISAEGVMYPVTQPPATTNNICLSGVIDDQHGITVAKTSRAFLFGVTEGTDVDVGRAETVSLAQQLATQYGWTSPFQVLRRPNVA